MRACRERRKLPNGRDIIGVLDHGTSSADGLMNAWDEKMVFRWVLRVPGQGRVTAAQLSAHL